MPPPPPPSSSPPAPAPTPPAVAEDNGEEEPRPPPPPPMRMKLFTYAAYRVLGGMGRAGDHLVAAVLIHFLNIVASLLSFYAGGEQARFLWMLVGRVTQFLCYAFYTSIACVFIRYYMHVDGDYHETIQPLQRQEVVPTAAVELEQLPPPPPEMDMC